MIASRRLVLPQQIIGGAFCR